MGENTEMNTTSKEFVFVRQTTNMKVCQVKGGKK